MAKITDESREDFFVKMQPYKELVDKAFEKEKDILGQISKDGSGAGYKKLLTNRCETYSSAY